MLVIALGEHEVRPYTLLISLEKAGVGQVRLGLSDDPFVL